jgi:hypothetical protein
MRTSFLCDTQVVKTTVGPLFDEKPPILVEVRFSQMGTSSDWFLCEDAAALDIVLDRLGPGAEIHLSSVWDLKIPAGAVVAQIKKQASPADCVRFKSQNRRPYDPPYERVTRWSPVPAAGECDKRSLEYIER